MMKYWFLITGILFMFLAVAYVMAGFMALEPTGSNLFVICAGFAALFLGGLSAIVHFKTLLDNEKDN
jgi:uncharacterized protein YsxB (DUF464 family)